MLMTKPVSISNIIDAFDVVNSELHCYLNKETGEISFISQDEMSLAEDEESESDVPEWQRESLEITKQILDGDEKFLLLPDQFHLDERSIMFDFAYHAEEKHRTKLLKALHERRPYRRFKDKVIELGIDKKWYDFREANFREVAIDWCKDNGIDYIE
jgi:hypothetical protein